MNVSRVPTAVREQRAALLPIHRVPWLLISQFSDISDFNLAFLASLNRRFTLSNHRLDILIMALQKSYYTRLECFHATADR